MTKTYCLKCYTEMYGGACEACVLREASERQLRAAQQRITEWYAERPVKLPLQFIRHDGWDYGPEWHKDTWLRWQPVVNVMMQAINELHDQLQDLKFELMEKEQDDHRCSKCGSLEGGSVT